MKDRFGNKQMIINKHVEGLVNMAPVTSNNDLKGLRKIYDLERGDLGALLQELILVPGF